MAEVSFEEIARAENDLPPRSICCTAGVRAVRAINGEMHDMMIVFFDNFFLKEEIDVFFFGSLTYRH